jgi:IS5 family transposase
MVGRQSRWQEDLFIAGPLRDLIPDDHILKKVDRVLDLSWLTRRVGGCYDPALGRPGIDPEAAVRLMLAGFFAGIVHDRKLLREAQVNLAIRWFAGYRLSEKLPDHSSLTRIRQRWGPETFKAIFLEVLRQCIAAGLVTGETVHVDATLIRADVSWESLVERHAETVLEENPSEEPCPDDPAPSPKPGRPKTSIEKPKKQSTTDPEATLTTSNHNQRMEPSYKQHMAVDDRSGVIVDVEVTTGEASEGEQLLPQIERIEANTGTKIKTLTADAGYAHGRNYAELETRGIDGIIPPQTEGKNRSKLPLCRFKYDARHQCVCCPGGKTLTRRYQTEAGWFYRARARECRACPFYAQCVPASGSARTILIVHGYDALLRARRRRSRWTADQIGTYQRHRWLVEGRHGEAKTQHGLRRAVRRGLANVAIQAFLTAVVMNLKRLASLFYGFYPRTSPEHHTIVIQAGNLEIGKDRDGKSK